MVQTKKLTKSCGTVGLSPSIMNLEQLIFTWKERQLVLALLGSKYIIKYLKYFMLNGKHFTLAAIKIIKYFCACY